MTISNVPKESLFLIRYPLWYLRFLPCSQMSLIPPFPLFLPDLSGDDVWKCSPFQKWRFPERWEMLASPRLPGPGPALQERKLSLSHQVVAARSMAIWHQSLSPLLFHFIPLYFLSYLTTQSCPDIFYYFISSSIFFCISISFKYA